MAPVRAEHPAPTSLSLGLERLFTALAPHEAMLVVYLVYLSLRLHLIPESGERAALLLAVGGALVLYAAALAVARGSGDACGWRRAVLRVAPLVAIFGPYAVLARVIPALNPVLRDEALYRLDLALFGFEPALAWQHLMTRPLVEWLSVFYMSYWVVTLGFILWHLGPAEPRRSLRFASSMIASVVLGHMLYIAVPGFGPLRALQFDGPLPGGPAFELMMRVCAAGAQRDIFPSLHTGHMVLLVLFCVAERRTSRACRWLALPVCFVALNVVLATVLLRWHYLVDLAAGVMLAVLCHRYGRRLVEAWEQRRAARGLDPVPW